MASLHDEVHKLINEALDKLKAAATATDRFDRLDAHAATVHMVVDEIPVAEPAQAPPLAPLATSIP